MANLQYLLDNLPKEIVRDGRYYRLHIIHDGIDWTANYYEQNYHGDDLFDSANDTDLRTALMELYRKARKYAK
jgi:hypothetical protein